jgi:hypothetical protein
MPPKPISTARAGALGVFLAPIIFFGGGWLGNWIMGW